MRFGEARVAAVTVSAVVVGLIGAGHLASTSIGAATDPGTVAHVEAPAAGMGSGPGDPTPSPSPSPTPSPSTDAESGNDAAALLAVPPAAEPATGLGQPPLSMPGTGPHGTLRTTGDDWVALTFDDGPDPRWTPKVLNLLQKHGVRATFCLVGQLADAYPRLVADIAAAGHTLCNHSWSHDFGLGSRSRPEIRDDLRRTNRAIQAAAPGVPVSYYRQPGGAWTERVVEVAAELGMSSLHWEVDPQDWRRPGADAIAAYVRSATGAGAIVLLHDGGGDRHGTVVALRRLLPDLTDRWHLAALPPGTAVTRRRGYQSHGPHGPEDGTDPTPAEARAASHSGTVTPATVTPGTVTPGTVTPARVARPRLR